MMRAWMPVGLVCAGLILSGCSNWHYVDLAQWRQTNAAAADQSSRHVKTSLGRPQASSPWAAAAQDAVESTATVGKSRPLKPWPKVGTPEWDQLQAEEMERERRVKEAVQSICRGC